MNFKFNKSFVLRALAALALSALLSVGVCAAGRVPAVSLDGKRYSGSVRLIDGTAYVKLREFSEKLGGVLSWSKASSTASAYAPSLRLSAKVGERFAVANGRYLWGNGAIFIENGSTYVPLRAVGTAFGFSTEWDAESFSASLTRHRDAALPADKFYDTDEVYWLSRIISAEAKGEPMEGKIAVGTVVLNRVASNDFPDSVYSVIFDTAGGVQFTPAANGTVYLEPDAESVAAAKLCLDGARVGGSSLFFINVKKAESFWITENRRYVMTVGNHDFYA